MATKKAKVSPKKQVNDQAFWMVIAFTVLSVIFFALAYYKYM